MRAVLAEKHGGPDVLAIAQLPDPSPGPGQLLVEEAAAGITYMDIH